MHADELQHRPRLPSRWRCQARVDADNYRSRCFKFASHVRSKKGKRRRHEAYGYFPGATFQGGTVEWTGP